MLHKGGDNAWALSLSRAASKNFVPTAFSKLVDLYTQHHHLITPIDDHSRRIHPYAVSPNSLTSRFETMCGKDGFRLIDLPVHKKFLNDVAAILSSPVNYYYEGPQGIGKSFTLLSAVIALRGEVAACRIIYVNNPELWKHEPFQYIVNEMVWAFMEDRNSFPRPEDAVDDEKGGLEQWYNRLMNSNNKQADYSTFLFEARKYCNDKKLVFACFMDQENSVSTKQILSKSEFVYEFPFNYYQEFPSVYNTLCFASANNNTHIKRTEGWVNFANVFKASISDFAFPGKPSSILILSKYAFR